MSKVLNHRVSEDGLTIQLVWFDFRKKHGIDWKKVTNKNGEIKHVPTWPQDCLDFIREQKIRYRLVGNGKLARTPDGRTVEMKDIIFLFPSKDIAALFKLSYL